jgi:hypothetical protein
MEGMTARFAEIPLARAHAHLTGNRFPEAIGAYRAALGVDPTVAAAHFGLADARSALGRHGEAVEGLVGAAEAFSTRSEHEDAIRLLLKAMAIDPSRMELHLDVAMVEEAMGNHDAAVARIEGLADRYMDDGRFEEAAELLRLLASWDEETQGERAQLVTPVPEVALPSLAPLAVVPAVQPQIVARPAAIAAPVQDVALPRPAAVVVEQDTGPRNTVLITGETVIAFNPLLLAKLAFVAPARAPEVDMESRVTLVHGGSPRSEPVPAATSVSAPTAIATPRPAPRPTPARLPPQARPEVVERLRARAGLGQAKGSPRRASVRVTEPITVRTAAERLPQDEDVTRYFRRPQGLDVAS